MRSWGCAGRAADNLAAVAGLTAAPLAVVEVRRPVPGLNQVDLRHHPSEIRTHVPHMVRTVLIPIVFVIPPGLQAFGFPVAHPVSDAAGGLDRCRQQNQDRYRQRRREQWLQAERPSAFAWSVEPGIPACVPDPRSGPARDRSPCTPGDDNGQNAGPGTGTRPSRNSGGPARGRTASRRAKFRFRSRRRDDHRRSAIRRRPRREAPRATSSLNALELLAPGGGRQRLWRKPGHLPPFPLQIALFLCI